MIYIYISHMPLQNKLVGKLHKISFLDHILLNYTLWIVNNIW